MPLYVILFDIKVYIKYNNAMKNLIMDGFYATINGNLSVCFLLCALILFRTQISEMTDRWVILISYVFKNFANFLSFVIATFGGLIFSMGQSGGIFFAEFAMNHIMPVIVLMLMEFAAFLLMIFNYFLHSHNKCSRLSDTTALLKSAPVKEPMLLFHKPSLALLQ